MKFPPRGVVGNGFLWVCAVATLVVYAGLAFVGRDRTARTSSPPLVIDSALGVKGRLAVGMTENQIVRVWGKVEKPTSLEWDGDDPPTYLPGADAYFRTNDRNQVFFIDFPIVGAGWGRHPRPDSMPLHLRRGKTLIRLTRSTTIESVAQTFGISAAELERVRANERKGVTGSSVLTVDKTALDFTYGRLSSVWLIL